MSKIVRFLKNEVVLCVSFVLAVISMFIIPPNVGYLKYVDYSVIAILFCLMVTIQGLNKLGVFEVISQKLTSHFSSTRSLSAVLVLLCFFMAMLITNDVALLTFVPLTLMLFKGRDKVLIRCIVLETAAANLGSMVTPIGNPQNLYIYSAYEMAITDFFKTMLPISTISLTLILLSLFLIPSQKIEKQSGKAKFSLSRNLFVYIAIFILCICTVAKFVDYRICLAITLLAAVIFDIKVLAKPDYSLLATFVCFFIFVGNISNIPAVSTAIGSILSGKELIIGALLSQVISNVPCALMLSGFTDNAKQLLLGVNIGGMGTLIASLASLISFKLYAVSENAKKGRYFAEFTIYNFAFLIILMVTAFLIY